MNVKRFLLLPGALAIALSYAAPMLPVAAQTPTAPAEQHHKRGANLNLTEDQKTQLKQIREATRSQIDAILTPEQKAKLDAAKQQRQQGQQEQGQQGQRGQKPRGMWASLNLTADQKARIKTIRQDAKQKMDAVLTAEQRQKLEQHRQQRQQNRQQPAQ